MNEATNFVAGRSYTSSGVPHCSITPPFMIATRSLMVSASSWSWVTKTNVMPTSRWIYFSSTCIWRRSLRSSAASGSSSSSTGRTADERARERDALALTAGERTRSAVRHAAELHELEHVGDPRLDLSLSDTLAAQAERDVVRDVEVLEQRVALEDGVHVALVRRQTGDVVAVDAGWSPRSGR